MRYDLPKRQRRSVRLRGYNYADAGSYFVTICTADRECILGDVVDGEVRLSARGEVASEEWQRSAAIRDELE